MKQKLVTGRGEYVFVNPRKGRGFLDRRNWLRKLCDDAGVKRFGFHAIRHLAAHIAILSSTYCDSDGNDDLARCSASTSTQVDFNDAEVC
jgi:integrase